MRIDRWMPFVIAAGLAVPAAAGEKGSYKCEHETQACLNKMASKLQNRGWVGIEMDHDESTGKISIKRVVAESPAEAAGLQTGDTLLALNGIRFSKENEAQVKETYKALSPGGKATYTVLRDGKERQVDVTLANPPREVVAQWIGGHLLDSHAAVQVAEK